MSEQMSASEPLKDCSTQQRPNASSQNNHSRGDVHSSSGGNNASAGPPENAQIPHSEKWHISFRVRRIPNTIDSMNLSIIISELFRLEWSSFEVYSLATDICNGKDNSYRTATVSFQQTPSLFRDRQDDLGRNGVAIPYNHFSVPHPKPLVFDTHFSGFTPLSSWENDQEHAITCIFIHGWGGHAIGSFRSAVDSHVWPRDSLPNHLPTLRVWTYGYGSKLTESKSLEDPYVYAAEFRDHFRDLQNRTNAIKHPTPIIFVVHSLGSWVLKRSLARMHFSNESLDRISLQSVYGALFFGDPGQGMDVAALATMVEGTPHEYTVNLLNQHLGFQLRNEEQEDFRRATRYKDSEIVHFFERRKSKTVIKDPLTGKYTRDGPETLLVAQASATYGRHWKDGYLCVHSLNRNHFDLVKFSEFDQDYAIVIDVIEGFSDKAVDAISKRMQCRTRIP